MQEKSILRNRLLAVAVLAAILLGCARAGARHIQGDHRAANAGAAIAGHCAAHPVDAGHALWRAAAPGRSRPPTTPTQMTATVTALQQKIAAQNDALNGKLDTATGQVQSLNDSVDELKSRIAKLDKSIQDLQTQLQNIQTPPQLRQPPRRGTGSSGAASTGGCSSSSCHWRGPADVAICSRAIRRIRRRLWRRPFRPACATTTPPATMLPPANFRT